MKRCVKYSVICLFLLLGVYAQADDRPYLCEFGVQGGCGYYVGDATPHIFMDVREAYGAHFRYKFTSRWALQVKGMTQRIVGSDYTIRGEQLDTRWENHMVNMDVMAEFNFFRYGIGGGHTGIKPYSPYIFLGIGAAVYGYGQESFTMDNIACYVPVGIGFKWKFADWCGLNIAWQHNIYMTDNIECKETLDNKHQLNGWNWMNCDLTGQLTLGLVFEFGRAPGECRICNY